MTMTPVTVTRKRLREICMTWRKVFVRAGIEKRFFLWVKVGFLNLKRLVALPEEFFGRGRRMLAIQVM